MGRGLCSLNVSPTSSWVLVSQRGGASWSWRLVLFPEFGEPLLGSANFAVETLNFWRWYLLSFSSFSSSF